MIVLIVAIAVVVGFFILTVGTWVVQWGLTEIVGTDIPFWPLFWILFVLYVLVGGSSASSRK